MLSFSDYARRWFAEFLSDWTRDLWQQLGLALVIALVTFGLQIAAKAITDPQIPQALEFNFLPLVVAAAVLAVFHLVRAPWRLQAVAEAELQRLRPRAGLQESIDMLGSLLAAGRELYAWDAALNVPAWTKERLEWVESVKTLVGSRFTREELYTFDPIGPLPQMEHTHAFGSQHHHGLTILSVHLDRVERIIETNKARLHSGPTSA